VREQELLAALALKAPGIEMHMGVQNGAIWASVIIMYEPHTRACKQTLFDATFNVARRLILDPQCPPEVRVALEDYDQHSRLLQI
jgi:hypothetical protein